MQSKQFHFIVVIILVLSPVFGLTFSVAVPGILTFAMVDFSHVYHFTAIETGCGSFFCILELVIKLFETIAWSVPAVK